MNINKFSIKKITIIKKKFFKNTEIPKFFIYEIYLNKNDLFYKHFYFLQKAFHR